MPVQPTIQHTATKHEITVNDQIPFSLYLDNHGKSTTYKFRYYFEGDTHYGDVNFQGKRLSPDLWHNIVTPRVQQDFVFIGKAKGETNSDGNNLVMLIVEYKDNTGHITKKEIPYFVNGISYDISIKGMTIGPKPNQTNKMNLNDVIQLTITLDNGGQKDVDYSFKYSFGQDKSGAITEAYGKLYSEFTSIDKIEENIELDINAASHQFNGVYDPKIKVYIDTLYFRSVRTTPPDGFANLGFSFKDEYGSRPNDHVNIGFEILNLDFKVFLPEQMIIGNYDSSNNPIWNKMDVKSTGQVSKGETFTQSWKYVRNKNILGNDGVGGLVVSYKNDKGEYVLVYQDEEITVNPTTTWYIKSQAEANSIKIIRKNKDGVSREVPLALNFMPGFFSEQQTSTYQSSRGCPKFDPVSQLKYTVTVTIPPAEFSHSTDRSIANQQAQALLDQIRASEYADEATYTRYTKYRRFPSFESGRPVCVQK